MSGALKPDDAAPTPREVLENGLADYFGRPVAIVDMTGTSLWGGGNDYPLQRMAVTLASGETLSVIFKRLLPDPDPVGKSYLREVLVYRLLLAGGRFDAPALYASVHDEARDRYWLFVEDIGDRTLDDADDVEDWLSAVRWLARLHRAYAGRAEELRNLGCLGEHDERFYHTLGAKARQNFAAAGNPEAFARFEELMSDYGSVVSGLVARPRSLVHGDFASHNVALQPGGRIRAIDWEWAAVGIGAWDLVRLLYGWGFHKAMLIDAYVAELGVGQGAVVDREEIAATVSLCDFVYRIWILSQQPEVCHDASRRGELLDEIAEARQRYGETQTTVSHERTVN